MLDAGSSMLDARSRSPSNIKHPASNIHHPSPKFLDSAGFAADTTCIDLAARAHIPHLFTTPGE
jgi:hypothetical protein